MCLNLSAETRGRRSWVIGLIVGMVVLGVMPVLAQDSDALTTGSISLLPADQQAPWLAYLAKSRQLMQADKAVIDAELLAHNMKESVGGPDGPSFKVESAHKDDWYATSEGLRVAISSCRSKRRPGGGASMWT